MAIRGADTSGGSVRLELGAKLLANEKSPWSLDLCSVVGEEKGILGTIAVLKSLNWDKKNIALKLVEVFGLDDKAANGYVDANW